MTSLALFLWFLNMLVDAGGQLSFKAAAGHGLDISVGQHWKYMLARPWIWIGVMCYVAEFFVWLAFLSQISLSTGIMLGSINIVVIMMAGRLVFKEKLTPWRIAGISLITLGVAIVGLGE